jgi:hypothetical protein
VSYTGLCDLYGTDLCDRVSVVWRRYDKNYYSAFPHVIRLEGDELLLSLRQAPATTVFHHCHPRSVVTVLRSYDAGASWDLEAAAQVAAGGGQELGLIYLGDGRVGGCLASHEVVRESEKGRQIGYAVEDDDGGFQLLYSNQAASWVFSTNHGLTFPLANHVVLDPTEGPFNRSHSCSAPTLLSGGQLVFANYGTGSGGPTDGYRDGEPPTSVLFVSRDQGSSWDAPITMARGDQLRGYTEPAVVETTTPGHLFAVYRPEGVAEDGSGGQKGALWCTGEELLMIRRHPP